MHALSSSIMTLCFRGKFIFQEGDFLVALAGIQATYFFRTINFQISLIHVFTIIEKWLLAKKLILL